MPLNTFYFPLPDTLAALLGYVIPFDIAFKFVTILGSLTLPIAAWAFGRLAGMERPRPAVLAVFTLPFLFDQTFTIYGGNLYSTMAGEYAFSLGLSVALVFLGVVVRGMRTNRSRIPAVLLLLGDVSLCHLVPTLFCFVGAGAALLFFGPTRRARVVAGLGGRDRLPPRGVVGGSLHDGAGLQHHHGVAERHDLPRPARARRRTAGRSSSAFVGSRDRLQSGSTGPCWPSPRRGSSPPCSSGSRPRARSTTPACSRSGGCACTSSPATGWRRC